jgi:hypothetical protein
VEKEDECAGECPRARFCENPTGIQLAFLLYGMGAIKLFEITCFKNVSFGVQCPETCSPGTVLFLAMAKLLLNAKYAEEDQPMEA